MKLINQSLKYFADFRHSCFLENEAYTHLGDPLTSPLAPPLCQILLVYGQIPATIMAFPSASALFCGQVTPEKMMNSLNLTPADV